MTILTGTRVYSTGEKPENPIIRDVVHIHIVQDLYMRITNNDLLGLASLLHERERKGKDVIFSHWIF